MAGHGIEDAWLTLWRDARVEVGLLATASTGGPAVLHGTLRFHDAASIVLGGERGTGTILINRSAIAYVRPHGTM